VNKPSGKGPRVIVVHAITVNGWVDNAQLVFDANRRTGDYHGQMNWDNFSKWFETQLLPNIPANSLIILDNARYHNVFTESAFPVPTTRKEVLSTPSQKFCSHYWQFKIRQYGIAMSLFFGYNFSNISKIQF